MSRVGFVFEGQSEWRSFRYIYEQLEERTNRQMVKPVLAADMQPLSTPAAIARSAAKRMGAYARNVELAVVCIDFETRSGCPGEFADDIRDELLELVPYRVDVVVKDSKYENWLIASPSGVSAAPARFPQHQLVSSKVRGNADRLDAERLLDRACRTTYDKVSDSCAIMQGAIVDEMASHSRSFRRLLRVIGDPAYSAGSRRA